MKKLRITTIALMTLVSIVFANTNVFAMPSSPITDEVMKVNDGEEESDNIANAILTEANVEVKFKNGGSYPWVINSSALDNGNCGKKIRHLYLPLPTIHSIKHIFTINGQAIHIAITLYTYILMEFIKVQLPVRLIVVGIILLNLASMLLSLETLLETLRALVTTVTLKILY